MSVRWVVSVMVGMTIGGAAAGCGDSAQPDAPGSASAALTTTAASQEAPGNRIQQKAGRVGARMAPGMADSPQMKSNPAGDEIHYPADGITPIAGSCTSPWVLLASGGGPAMDGATIPATEQAILANAQFVPVDSDPHSAGQISVELHKKGDAFLLARCHDAGTCTRLAGMEKAVVPGTSPKTGCGDLPEGLSASTKQRVLKPALAQKGDTFALCARLGACAKADKPTSTEDVITACQKSASSFKTDCALEPTCEKVVACQKK